MTVPCFVTAAGVVRLVDDGQLLRLFLNSSRVFFYGTVSRIDGLPWLCWPRRGLAMSET